MCALGDLGLTSVDRLLDVLYTRNVNVHDIKNNPDEVVREKEMLVQIIRAILQQDDEELRRMTELAANFLTLYANGMSI